MLWTTYAAKFKTLSEKQKRQVILIARTMKEEDFKGARKDIRLAPSSQLLYDIKNKTIDFEEYTERFLIQLETTSSFKGARELYVRLKNGEDVILMCFEKDNTVCHRRLIAEYLEKNGGIEWREL